MQTQGMALRLSPAQHLKMTVATGLERARGSGGAASNRHGSQAISSSSVRGARWTTCATASASAGSTARQMTIAASAPMLSTGMWWVATAAPSATTTANAATRHRRRRSRRLMALALIILDVTRAGSRGAPSDLAGAATFAEGGPRRNVRRTPCGKPRLPLTYTPRGYRLAPCRRCPPTPHPSHGPECPSASGAVGDLTYVR